MINIRKSILIEKLIRNELNAITEEIQWYCFQGKPKLCLRIAEGTNNKITLYDEQFNLLNYILSDGDEVLNIPCDDLIKQTFVLSKKLAVNFKFVRVDWIVYQNKVYFEEMTFTPYSGFSRILTSKFNKKFGKWLQI